MKKALQNRARPALARPLRTLLAGLALGLLALAPAASQTATMSTFAGTGAPGFSGDGGPATSAQLYFPTGVAVDGSGTVYIADQENHRIRRVGPTGVVSTLAGTGTAGFSGDGGPAISAQLNGPTGAAVDGSGNVYIADTGSNRIRRVSPTGIMSTFAGTGTAGFSGDGGPATSAQLRAPIGVAVDGSGNVYIADYGNHRIRRVTAGAPMATARAQASALTLWPNPAPRAATLSGLAPHAGVQVLDALGRPVTTATADAEGTARLVLPAGLASGVYLVRSGAQVCRLVVE